MIDTNVKKIISKFFVCFTCAGKKLRLKEDFFGLSLQIFLVLDSVIGIISCYS